MYNFLNTNSVSLTNTKSSGYQEYINKQEVSHALKINSLTLSDTDYSTCPLKRGGDLLDPKQNPVCRDEL